MANEENNSAVSLGKKLVKNENIDEILYEENGEKTNNELYVTFYQLTKKKNNYFTCLL